MKDVSVYRNGRQQVLRIKSLSVIRGELVALVGPNGAGKSTLLQTINLLRPYQGNMRLFGEEAGTADHNLLRRRTSMVFQETLLLGGSVFDNVAWPLRFRGVSETEIKMRVQKSLGDFGCGHLALRQAKLLSGGEAQRVCIARALVTDPELLLLDEPFASLDVAMRNSMMEEIRTVALNRGISVLLVSHNFSDVLYFTERAVAIFDGHILQDDCPETLMRRPADERVARLVGMDNVLPCELSQIGENRFITLPEGIRFIHNGPIPASASFCCFPGDALVLAAGQNEDPTESRVLLEGMIERIMPGIGTNRVLVRRGNLTLNVRLVRNCNTMKMQAGERIRLSFDPAEIHIV